MARRIPSIKSEDYLHLQCADYLRTNYPNIIFRSDYASGLKLTPAQAMKHKRLQSGRAWVDISIFESSYKDNLTDYSALFIELKAEGAVLYKKDGTLSSNQHIQEQAATLRALRQRGNKAEFAQGFDQFKEIVDHYLKGGLNNGK